MLLRNYVLNNLRGWIVSKIGYRIIKDINRAPQDLIESFRNLAVANIADCMNRFFCLNSDIKIMNDRKNIKMIGSAFTVKTRPTDNLFVHKAIAMAEPNDIIIINAFGNLDTAILGEIMTLTAMKKGLGGIVVDGCIRDIGSIREMNIPVFAKGITPKGPFKDGPGEINIPISCGNVVINPGDIIIGDCDGVVVVRPLYAKQILEEVKIKSIQEKNKIQNIKENKDVDKSWIDKKLEKIGYEV